MSNPVPSHELNVKSINRFDKSLRFASFWLALVSATELWFGVGQGPLSMVFVRFLNLLVFGVACMYFYGAIWVWEIHVARAENVTKMKRSLGGWLFLGIFWMTIVVAFLADQGEVTHAKWRQINFMLVVLGLISSAGILKVSQIRKFWASKTKLSAD